MFGKNKNGCFDCDACPQTNDRTQKRYCVAWMEVTETNERGEVRIRKDCGWTILPEIMIQNTRASAVLTANVTQLPSRFKRAILWAEPMLKKLGHGS